jgi:urea transporter
LVLAAYPFGAFTISGMGPPALMHSAAATMVDLATVESQAVTLVEAWLKGPAQVFLINNWISGVLVVIGLAVSSLWAAGFALVGSAVGVAMALALGASLADIDAGLFGFSAVLTAVGLGCVFFPPGWRVALFMLLATVFTVIVQAALDAALAPVGIPTFTAPFVFVTWLFLLPKADLKPHPHAPIENGLVGRSGAK